MTLYIGADFHPPRQTRNYAESATCEIFQTSLRHNVELARRFYERFEAAVVGIE